MTVSLEALEAKLDIIQEDKTLEQVKQIRIGNIKFPIEQQSFIDWIELSQIISPNFLAFSSKTTLPNSFIRKYSISDLRNSALQLLNDANNPNIIYTLHERSLSLRNSDVLTLFGSSLLNNIFINVDRIHRLYFRSSHQSDKTN
jgi:desulfoferrodoxin (superoxide reductase-like protein)